MLVVVALLASGCNKTENKPENKIDRAVDPSAQRVSPPAVDNAPPFPPPIIASSDLPECTAVADVIKRVFTCAKIKRTVLAGDAVDCSAMNQFIIAYQNERDAGNRTMLAKAAAEQCSNVSVKLGKQLAAAGC
jgi:hypothetical protein